MKFKKWYIVFLLFLFIGCGMPTVEEYANTFWKGQSVEELKEAVSKPRFTDGYAAKIGWTETTYRLDNGNWVYVELIRRARNDFYIHWEINPSGIVIGSSIEKTGRPPRQD